MCPDAKGWFWCFFTLIGLNGILSVFLKQKHIRHVRETEKLTFMMFGVVGQVGQTMIFPV